MKWICERIEGTAKAQKTAIGNLPEADALDLTGLDLAPEDVKALESVDAAGWKREAEDIGAYYAKFDGRLPQALKDQLAKLHQRLG